jgi:serine/threonine protein kinase
MTEEHDADVTRPRSPRGDAGRVEFSVGSLIDGRYQLVDPLGEGGMGRVFKALDRLAEAQEARDPYVAIKILKPALQTDPTAVKALHREFARARGLNHPSILRIDQFAQDRETGLHFIVMELLQGRSLDSVIAQNRRMGSSPAWPEISSLFAQICAGLQCAHEQGVIHSDVKPSNLFITAQGKIKILDFGIAALRPGLSDDSRVTRYDPRQLGALSPGYASLEMFEGRAADDSDDVYSLACVTYEWLSGRHPYAAQPGPAVPAPEALAARPPPDLPELTRAQNTGLRDALALRREKRTPTIGQLLESMTAEAPARGGGQALTAAAGVLRQQPLLQTMVLLTFVVLLSVLLYD